MAVDLDVAYARTNFPGLSDGFVLADNAGGSVPCRQVITRIGEYLQHDMVQLGASYPRSRRAGERVTAGKRAAACLLGGDPDQVFLGASTTLNLRTLAASFARLLRPGDEVVVTDLDHESNIGPWRALEERGVRVVTWSFDREQARLTLEGLERALTPRTRLVCFTHVANVVGAIHDVARFARRIREAGAWSVVDGVAFAPHRRVDAPGLGVDAYCVSLYKIFGPHMAATWVRAELMERLSSQNHFFIGKDAGPYRFEPGNVNHEVCAGLAGVVDYFDQLHDHHFGTRSESPEVLDRVFGLFADHESALAARLLEFLASRDDIRILGPRGANASERVPTIAFTVDGQRASAVPPLVEGDGIGIRWGHFYAQRAIDALGLLERDGVVRVSLVHYNTLAEVDALIRALEVGLESLG